MFNDEIILKSKERFKSNHHDVYTEQINKITLSSNDYLRDCKDLIKLQHIHTEKTHSSYAKVRYDVEKSCAWKVFEKTVLKWY